MLINLYIKINVILCERVQLKRGNVNSVQPLMPFFLQVSDKPLMIIVLRVNLNMVTEFMESDHIRSIITHVTQKIKAQTCAAALELRLETENPKRENKTLSSMVNNLANCLKPKDIPKTIESINNKISAKNIKLSKNGIPQKSTTSFVLRTPAPLPQCEQLLRYSLLQLHKHHFLQFDEESFTTIVRRRS